MSILTSFSFSPRWSPVVCAVTHDMTVSSCQVPWTWGEAVYQPGPDMGNLAAPPPKNPLVPWTWDDVIYQSPGAE